jgi:hypothetical protein
MDLGKDGVTVAPRIHGEPGWGLPVREEGFAAPMFNPQGTGERLLKKTVQETGRQCLFVGWIREGQIERSRRVEPPEHIGHDDRGGGIEGSRSGKRREVPSKEARHGP